MPLDLNSYKAALRIDAQMLFTRKAQCCFCRTVRDFSVLQLRRHTGVIDDKGVSLTIGEPSFMLLDSQNEAVTAFLVFNDSDQRPLP